MKTMKVSLLVLDFDLYPRQQIDSHHVGEMVAAEEAGVKFPPIVIDKKSKRVTDGWHRVRMKQRLYKENAEIEVIEKTYRNEREMFLDAIRLNASHGRNLSSYDRAHCALRAGELGIKDDVLAGALLVTVARVDALRVNKAATVGTGKAEVTVPIKRTIGHMAGKRLTRPQQEANKKLGGMAQLFYVNQLIMLIETDLLDTANKDLMAAIEKLAGMLPVGVKV